MLTHSKEPGMSVIVKTVTRLTLAFIVLFGIYVALHGHISPGGGFAGGVIVALSFAHIMLAFGKDAALKQLSPGLLRVVACVGMLALLYSAVFRHGGDTMILNNVLTLPVYHLLIVGSGLYLIFLTLVTLSRGEGDPE